MAVDAAAWLHDCGGGVHAIDTGFHRDAFDASFLIVRRGRAAFVDTGTNLALPRLLGALDALGLARDKVDYVIPTHVHLDHAGGAGLLMSELPRATLMVHARGARHLIDPSDLYAGALAVYGQQEMDRSYGRLVPVPAERVCPTSDGMLLELGGSTLRFADTPGHARHHHCVWDEATRGWFTGDTFGLSYREFDSERGPWMLPTSTPVQFEPEMLIASIRRLLAAEPDCVYLTHFGRLGNVAALGAQLIAQIEGLVRLGLAQRHAPDRHQQLRRGQLEQFMASLAEHRCTLPADAVARLLELDIELNAQGMACWLDRPPK